MTSNRRPSYSPLLGSPAGSPRGSISGFEVPARRLRGQWVRIAMLLGAVLVVGVYMTGSEGTVGEGRTTRKVRRRTNAEQFTLSPAGAAFGMKPPSAASLPSASSAVACRPADDSRVLTLQVRPRSSASASLQIAENTISSSAFHPSLTDHIPLLFSYPSTALKSTCSASADALELPLHPPSEPKMPASDLWFSICTSPERAEDFSEVWGHFMGEGGSLADEDGEEEAGDARPGCLITDAGGVHDEEGKARANQHLERIGSQCRMVESSRSGERYEMRVLGLLRDAWLTSEKRRWQEGGHQVEWFVFGDDDTWWSDIRLVRSLLEGYNPNEDHYLGSFSEARANLADNSRIAFGGAGIIVSRSLVRKMQPMIDRCAARFANIWGGDGLISHCAAWTMQTPLEHVVSEVPALKQMDIQGDASGYLASGAAPYLSLHHWASWLTLFPASPSRSPLSSITLLAQAAAAVGGRNFLTRYLFDGGLVSYSVGYSITVYREPLAEHQLGEVERTWEGFEPHRPSRARIEEGRGKRTYYLEEVVALGEGKTLFRHVCENEDVQEGLREIQVIWDLSADEAVVEVEPRWKGWLRSGRAKEALEKGRRSSGHALGRSERRQRRIR